MAETNEVVTFGDLYAMTSFLSNAEFIHSNYFNDTSNYTVQCIYESSKLFFILSSQCDAIIVAPQHSWQNDYYLLTKTTKSKVLRMFWEIQSEAQITYTNVNLVVNRTGKSLSYHLESRIHSLADMNLMIYEIP